MKPLVFAVVLISGLAWAKHTVAQPDLSPLQRPSRPMIEAAQAHYLSGARFFEAGSYDAALVEFEAAWRLSGEPDLLHNLSWTHEKAGRIKEAIEYAVRYQTAAQTVEDQERGRKRVGLLKQRYASGATESTTSPAPTQAPQTVPEKTPSAAPEPTKTESRHRVPSLAIGLLTAGGALTVGGIGCLAGAWSTSQQANSADLTFADGSALSSRGHALNATGIALTVVGGAVVVGGATWAILARRR